MLFFVGLGLYDEKDISLKGLEAVRTADAVYAEFYTSRLMGTSLEKLQGLYGKSIHLLSRPEVEGDPAWLEEAREKNVAFLVGGDPMVSTTHLDLRLRALEMGIKTKVIHSSSIVICYGNSKRNSPAYPECAQYPPDHARVGGGERQQSAARSGSRHGDPPLRPEGARAAGQ